jgi:hypothetical protein
MQPRMFIPHNSPLMKPRFPTQRTAAAPEPAPQWRRAASIGIALLALTLSACSQTAKVAPVQAQAEATQAAPAAEAVSPMSAPCIKRVPKPYKWEGYNDKLVDACIGPTHYRFPANLFRDQMGPDFQANFSLVVMWPDLKPAEPGKLKGQPMDLVMSRVHISPNYVDRVPVETLLERYISPSESQVRENDPTAILALRDRQPERFGLTPYFVNPALFEAREDQRQRATGSKFRAPLRNIDDWYLSRDASDRLTTLIKCDSHLRPEGYVAEGGALVKVPTERTNAQCSHHIVMDDVKASVEISYKRALLHEWKRFEIRARELFESHWVR